MAGLNYVSDLNNGNVSVLQMLQSYVFGDKIVNEYSANTVYNTGDLIIYIGVDGKQNILQAKEDNITGPFDASKWNDELLSNLNSTVSPSKLFVIDPVEPVGADSAPLWLYPVEEKTITFPASMLNVDTSKYKVLFSNDFPVTDVPPTSPSTNLFFDPENTGSLTYDSESTTTYFANAFKYTIDNQEDVESSDDPISRDNKLWLDTDLSDDFPRG